MTKQQAKEVLKMVEPTMENIEKIIDMIDEQTVTTTPYIPIEYPYPYQRHEFTCTDGVAEDETIMTMMKEAT